MVAQENVAQMLNGATLMPLFAKSIQQVLGFLSSLAGTRYTIIVPAFQPPNLQHTNVVALRKD